MANGMRGTRKGGKPSVKEMQQREKTLIDQVNYHFAMLKGRVEEVANDLLSMERQLNVVDTRSAALSRVLVAKGLVTQDQIKEAMDAVFVDAFNDRVTSEDAALQLETLPDAVVDDGTTYVVKFDTYENGERKAPLSSLRSQIQFGKNQLPAEFESGVKGAKAGDTREFEVDAPKAFGPAYEGRKLTFKVDVLAVKKQKPAPEATEVPAAQGA